ncbi:MAG: UDP-3-O-(3-hydroxymyristoyl)glucosamine N-acyltransferase [Acidobacteria bacterium]|nr:UDP-3-O-(3-hydroxymyristoyl)glucosamine N-acyltransferase [Acidobacteriota bacterium]
MTAGDMAALLGASVEGDSTHELTGVAPVDSAAADQISFAYGKRAAELAATARAGCLLVPLDFAGASTAVALIRVKDPRAAFARVIGAFHPPEVPMAGIHPSAVIAERVELGLSVSIAPHVTIGAGARIGDGTAIGAGCSIGADVRVGAGCRLAPRVTLSRGVTLGDRVTLHAGVVIGADGFGFQMVDGRYEKFPQIGTVRIDNDVEIGANSCIDRATMGVTVIGEGAKLDNLVHIAHNCQVGKHVVIAAQTGFAGGVVIEDYAIIGGQVGIGDKARVESRAVLGSGAGVLTSKIVRAGEVMWGTPARPLREYLGQLAALGKVPELRKQVRELVARIEAMEAEKRG